MTHATLPLTDALRQYLLAHSLREPPILQALRAETTKLSAHAMQISPEQGQFMQLLIQLLGAHKALELGVYTGYSALSVALALPETGRLIACDINTETTAIAQRFWQQAGVAHKVTLRLAPALETLNALLTAGEAGSFDFVFIDADKQNYVSYYEKSLSLLRQGGLMMIDNVLWQGRVADENVQDPDTQAIRDLNQRVVADARVRISLLPLGDGVTLAQKC